MNHKKASKKGLTLIEVLLAMVILTIGVSALMVAMSRCLGVVRTARNRETARSLIRLVDIDYPIERVDMTELSESGDFEGREGYTWFRDIEMVDEEERPGLFLITIRIQWAERGQNAFEEVSMYKYVPDAEILTKQI
jgi:prepilin-type N-terminal cleavage/methylation domain-containing protein